MLRAVLASFVLVFLGSQLLAQNLLVNGDFETDAYSNSPGYSGGENPEITGWTAIGNNGINPVFAQQNPATATGWVRNENSIGNAGINPVADGRAPFADNGDVDGGVLFVQGIASVYQDVSGLTVGEDYTLTVEYNARNCCGDVPAVTLEIGGDASNDFPDPDVFGDDIDIFPVEDGFWWLSEIPFTAEEETMRIEFFTEPFDGGDATFLLDNVSVELESGGDDLVVNGDFEADLDAFVNWPGYFGSGELVASAPFRDNGNNETQVAFIQNAGSIEQEVTGLTEGTEYTLSFDYNARNCCSAFPEPSLFINDELVDDFADEAEVVLPVEEDNDWYRYEATFVADDDSALVRIASMSELGEGDSTFLVDNVFFGIPGVDCETSTGDIDGSGTVDFPDFLVLSTNFGLELLSPANGDLNCSGTVDFNDFLILSTNFGTETARAHSVPEPTSNLLLLLLALVGGRRLLSARCIGKPSM